MNKPIITTQELRERILSKLPDGFVAPEHTPTEHFYRVEGNLYPSVTGALGILKDKNLTNYSMNKASKYILDNWQRMTKENVQLIITAAESQSKLVLDDAGSVGTSVHSYIEEAMEDYIHGGSYEKPLVDYIKPEDKDLRAVSALRAMESFIKDYDYAPAVSELLVYSHKLKLAGTIDGVGLVKTVIQPHAAECSQQRTKVVGKFKKCLECGYKSKREITLVDTKTSNQLKDYFFLQVALYAAMLREITGVKVDKVLIVQLSKETGTYKVEEVYKLSKVISCAKALLRVSDGIELIKTLRRDNQKSVGTTIIL